VAIELANKRDRKETLKREVRQRYKRVNKTIVITTESSIGISLTSV
jgi:hypothetical protein